MLPCIKFNDYNGFYFIYNYTYIITYTILIRDVKLPLDVKLDDDVNKIKYYYIIQYIKILFIF